jgi:O-antigen ligase
VGAIVTASDRRRLDRRTVSAVGAALVLIATAAVAWAGAIRPPATVALAAATGLTLLAVVLAATWRRVALMSHPLAWPIAVVLGLVLLQLVPLPGAVRARLSPTEESLRALLLRDLPHGDWRPLTVDVGATLDAALRLGAVLALLLVAAQLGRVGRFWLRATIGGAAAALLAPALLGVLGITLPAPLASTGPTQALLHFPFVDANHAAALLLLVIPLAVLWVAQGRDTQRLAAAALLTLLLLALVGTRSRAGLVEGVGAGAVTALLLARRADCERRVAAWIGGGLIAVGLLGIVLAAPRWMGLGGDFSWRWTLTRAGAAIARDHALVGVGRGAVGQVLPRYTELAARNRYPFLENGYLQLACDVGLLGMALVIAAFVRGWRQRVRTLPRSATELAARVGLVALAVHESADFAIEALGVALCACAVAALALRSVERLSRGAAAALALALLALCALSTTALGRSAEVEAQALLTMPADADALAARADAIFLRHPSDAFVADAAAARLLALGDARGVRWLDRALLVAPYDVEAHRLAARALASTGRRAQAASELDRALGWASDTDRQRLLEEAVTILRDEPTLLAPLAAVDPSVARRLYATLERERLWSALAAAAAVTEERAPDDVPALAATVRAALELATPAADAAKRLAALDHEPAGALLAARGLAQAGDRATAARVLDEQLRTGLTDERLVELATARAGLTVDPSEAAEVLQAAIARAVDVSAKATLHEALAEVLARAGRADRAAAERLEAARLRGH